MSVNAVYKKLNIYDYLFATAQTPPEHLDALASSVKALATLQAFVQDELNLGRATKLVSDCTGLLPNFAWRALIAAAHRLELSFEDPRRIAVSDAAIIEYERLKASGDWNALNRSETASDSAPYRQSGLKWYSIRSDDRSRYVEYWKIAYRDDYDRILQNGEVLAWFDAYLSSVDSEVDPHDQLYMVEEVAKHLMSSLPRDLWPTVLGNIRRDILCGLIEISSSLRSEYPEIYAKKGVD